MTTTSSADIERVAMHIAGYLAGNPHAADTAEGIQSWWLAGAVPGVSLDAVEAAVRMLVQHGALECRTLPDGTRVYARARPRAAHSPAAKKSS